MSRNLPYSLNVFVEVIGCFTGIKAAVILIEILVDLTLSLVGCCNIARRLMDIVHRLVLPVFA